MTSTSLSEPAIGASASHAPSSPVLARAGVPIWLVTFGFVAFLLWNTGFATDDYVFLLQGLNEPITHNLWPKTYVSVPVLHYTHALAYFILGNRAWAYDVLKAVYAGTGVYFASRFFSIFCSPRRALVLGFLFVFLPLYDAVVYSFTDLYLVISFTCFLYAYYLAERGRLAGSVVFALIGSFSSYGSPPIAIGLAALALLREQRKTAAALFFPNLVYLAYYLFTSQILNVGTQRLTGQFGIGALVKQFVLQAASFIDAGLGPSALLKIYYSIGSLDPLGWVIALVAGGLATYCLAAESRNRVDLRLLIAAAIILAG